jgi:formylglycine-generating enzyme required for sulfatase activity
MSRQHAIGQFAQTLTNVQLDFDAIDLADSLWLAQFMEPRSVLAAPPAVPDPLPPISQPVDPSPPSVNLYPDEAFAPPPVAPEPSVAPAPEKPKGTPFSVPAAPALRTRLDLARSLRPLMRKVPCRSRFELDEDATVNQIAETEVWMPVVQPMQERWLELDLVVEASKTTVIWERAIAELNQLAEYQGAFRAVRTWRLAAAGKKLQLFSRWDGEATTRPHTPRELIDPTGRRLIWLVTDCTSLLWRQEEIYRVLLDWAQEQPAAIVQMFPESLWSRTALRNGHIVRLSALEPGVPSGRLNVEGLPRRLEQRRGKDLVTVPIVTLEVESLRGWSRVAAGVGDSRTPGRSFDLKFIRKQMDGGRYPSGSASRSGRDARRLTAQERVAMFRATASSTAQTLADLMAAAPVSLPVIDLLREAFRADFDEEVQQSHVAEVLLSGLLRRCDDEAEAVCGYEFWGDDSPNGDERVRYVLLGDASIAKTNQVLDVLSAAICRKLNMPTKSFQALLGELQTGEGEVRAAALPFARVGLDVLRRLGGEYAEVANRYDVNGKIISGTHNRQNDFPLEDLEYEVAKLINFPTLQTCEYESASITAILDRFDFETATLVRSRPLLNRQKFKIQRRRAASWGYAEPLSMEGEESIALDMIAIPGGRFRMGAPKREPESLDWERPQHEVTLSPFYLSRYPITQAQWKIVAGYEQIDRELDPDPSRFKGDRRPVERVSWEDAQEFCQRLAQRTGLTYRLPSEAEWEYACRAGTETPFHFGETITPELVNYDGTRTYNDSPKGEDRQQTTDVGSFSANEWGLHDMHGNVWEWCEDDWHENYEGAPIDGSAWLESSPEGAYRLLRGGSWSIVPRNCRSASRYFNGRVGRSDIIGFRVVCVPPRLSS